MNRDEDSSLSASNIYEIIFQLDHNTVLKDIKDAKERFWDVVIIDMLINNNDRNEDNWGVIKDKENNSYRLAPIYDCGNCFYGKADNQKIKEILLDKEKLLSSSLNGVTAYEDNQERRIRNEDILRIKNKDLQLSVKRVYGLLKEKMSVIKDFITSIPSDYNGIEIMSDERKDYYIKTLVLRFEHLLSPLVRE